MTKLLLFIFLTVYSFASSDFDISKIEYFKDETKKVSFEEINSKNFIQENRQNFGLGNFAIWSKFAIQNNLNNEETFYAINYRTTLDYVDAYIIHADGKVEKYLIGDMRELENRPNSSRLLLFPINLKAQEKVELFIRHESARGVIETNWEIKDSENTNRFIYLDSLFFGIYIGIFLLLIILSLILYFAIKKRFLLYYSFVCIFILLGQLIFTGVLYSLNIGISLYIINHPEIPYYLTSLFLILFHYDFFEIEYQNKLLNKFIKFLLFIPISFVLINLILPSLLSEKIIPLSVFCHWFVSLSLIFIGIKMSIKGIKGGWFYVLGQSLSFLSMVIITFYTISYNNAAPTWTYYSIVIGSFLNLICLALALYVRLKQQQKTSLRKSEILMELSKFHNSEMIINNIIHQWKLPLSRIIAILTDLQAQIYFGKPIEKSVIEQLPEINKNAMLLAQIVQEFYKFNQSSEKTIFLYNEIYNEIIKMLSLKIEETNAFIDLKLVDNNFINADKFAISNISSIITNNFLDIAKIRKIKKPILSISIITEKSLTKILFEDNCGGIDIIPFEKVFEPFRSISEDKSKGLGLFIAKTLVEEKLQGKLKGNNTQQGAVFEIIF